LPNFKFRLPIESHPLCDVILCSHFYDEKSKSTIYQFSRYPLRPFRYDLRSIEWTLSKIQTNAFQSCSYCITVTTDFPRIGYNVNFVKFEIRLVPWENNLKNYQIHPNKTCVYLTEIKQYTCIKLIFDAKCFANQIL